MQNITLPGKWSLSQVTGLPRLKGTEDGQTEINKLNEANEAYKKHMLICKVLRWVLYIFFILLIADKWLYAIIAWAIGFFVFGKRMGYLTKRFTKEHDDAVNRYYNYWDQLANYISEKIFPGSGWNRFGLDYIVYSNDGMLYIDVNQDLLVGYKKSDIKEVTRERVHTGSHTTGNTTGVGIAGSKSGSSIGIGVGKARTNSDTTDYYEWHFDVMSDFMGYPKVSVVVADSPHYEDMINKMYAILKP